MHVEELTPILNVSDVPASILWFEKLGWRRGFAWNDGGMIANGELTNKHGPAQFGSVLCAPVSREPDSGGYVAPGGQIFLCKDGQGSRDSRPCPNPHDDNYGGVWMTWWVKDVNAAFNMVNETGIELIRSPANEPWGIREFLIRHPDGHYFRISGAMQEDRPTSH